MSNSKGIWDESFRQQSAASSYNLVPPEAVVRTVNYYLRARYQPQEYQRFHFLDVGCGAGSTVLWLARLGVRVSGMDISSEALDLCRYRSERDLSALECSRVLCFYEGSIAHKTHWEDGAFDGIITSNVLQHLDRDERVEAFNEIRRLLKTGGCLVCYEMSVSHFAFVEYKVRQRSDDLGTIVFDRFDDPLGLIGVTHFFCYGEFMQSLQGFSSIDPCVVHYDIPREERDRRGARGRSCSFYCVLAVK